MRRWLFLAFALFVPWPDSSSVQAADSGDDVKFETGDGVELQGSYYPSDKGKKAPCVILLHRIGGNRKEEGWESLALELQKKGYAVLAFDFRGHGGSTKIKDLTRFWTNSSNRQYLKANANPLKPRDTLAYKDIQNTNYYPMLVNDVAAAKLFLDIRKHDAGECNATSTILIGADDGATIGAMWLASDWSLHRVTPSFGGQPKVEKDPEGKDVVFAVWLGMTTSLNRSYAVPAHDWVKLVGKTYKMPMAFVYGSKDSRGEGFAKRAVADVKDKNNKFSGEIVIKDTNLSGAKLLNSNLDTQAEILKKLDEFLDEKQVAEWDRKEAKRNSYAWVRQFGGALPAKNPESEYMNPVPYGQLGLVR